MQNVCWLSPEKRKALIKMLIVMKLTAIIIFAACLQVNAKGYSQITLSEKNAPLEKVFNEVSRQSGYEFLYTTKMLQSARAVDIKVTNATLEDVLNICFKDQPFTFTIIEKTVVVKPKPATPVIQSGDLSIGFFLPPPPIDIRGRVTDPDGEPLVGATIKIKGNIAVAAITDGDGRFILKAIDENASIEISYVGFVMQTLSVKNRGNIILALKRNDSPLDEVHIKAYGSGTPRFNVGNQGGITAKDIEKQPVSNPLLALEGRVPGLFITQANGIAGGGVTVRVQGQNSISGGNDPLYVIDGVPYSSQMLKTTSGGSRAILGGSGSSQLYAPGGNGNTMSYINSADIESIEVLKDADATAIYGSRAANGAILITTKKGKAGRTKVDINMQQGWGQVSRSVNMMNTQQYLSMRREGYKNDNLLVPSITATSNNADYDMNGLWDTTRFTNWRKVLIGETAQYANLSATVSGGTANIQYLVGGTYHRETTVFPGNFSDQKGSLHFNLNSNSANQKFKIQFSASYLIDNNLLPQADLTAAAYQLAPNSPALYNADGTLNWAPTSAGTSSWTNPLNTNINSYQNKTNNLISNAILSYSIFPGLEIKSSFGYTNMQTNEFQPTLLLSIAPEKRPTSKRGAGYSYSNMNSWLIEPQANYKRIIGKGKLDVLVGTTIEQNNNNGVGLVGSDYNSDAVLHDIRSAATVTVSSTTESIYKYDALFCRLNYNLQDKYIIDITGRRDGSSRFGPHSQFHNFWSTAGGWIFSQENFFRKSLPIISFGKIKASYGTTGNDQIGDYSFMNLYNPIGGTPVPYQGATGLSANGLPNPYLQWEETKKLSLGLDLGLLKDRILFNLVYVYNHSSNQLLQYALPIITGNNGVLENFPASVQNTSWEFVLNSTNVKTKDFNWNSSVNLTIPQNKLVAFPNLITSTYASSLIIGQPVSIVQVLHFGGVDPATGQYLVVDIHGNPTVSTTYPDDYNVLINTLPNFYGGLQNSFSYKGFQLDLLFQFVKQIGSSSIVFGFNTIPGRSKNNQPVSMLDRWQKSGDITSIQRFSSNTSLFSQYSNANGSDASYSDASYVRLKNLSLSYKLADKWMQKAHLQNCSIYAQGQNLLTITKYKGLDPETQGFSLPPLRVITIGVQLGL